MVYCFQLASISTIQLHVLTPVVTSGRLEQKDYLLNTSLTSDLPRQPLSLQNKHLSCLRGGGWRPLGILHLAGLQRQGRSDGPTTGVAVRPYWG